MWLFATKKHALTAKAVWADLYSKIVQLMLANFEKLPCVSPLYGDQRIRHCLLVVEHGAPDVCGGPIELEGYGDSR